MESLQLLHQVSRKRVHQVSRSRAFGSLPPLLAVSTRSDLKVTTCSDLRRFVTTSVDFLAAEYYLKSAA